MIGRPLEPRAFLGVARVLSAFGEEASLRTAVGRAYYAAFLVARDRTGVAGSQNLHARVIEALGRAPAHRVAAFRLNALRRLRVVADYEMLASNPAHRNWSRNWTRAEELADQILSNLEGGRH